MRQDKTQEIRSFLLQAANEGRRDFVRAAAERFGVSRQAINRHIRRLVSDGFLTAEGKTRARVYRLKPLVQQEFRHTIAPDLAEDRAWRADCEPYLTSLSPNVLEICHYGFTEIFNNALDHSEGTEVFVHLSLTALAVEIRVLDDGVGIFKKVKEGLHLEDERHAILELAKGKVTTDPVHHTGEGVFFTSRMFDWFSMLAGHLYFSHTAPDNDWLIEAEPVIQTGTGVTMRIALDSSRTCREVFDRYATEQDDFAFAKTVVPISLLPVGVENLVSRSQAKRLLTRFDRFREVILDFKGVRSIGQAFADEIFRVYKCQHPNVQITYVNENEDVRKMIMRALAAGNEPS